jgi:DNA-binding LacI/PurR family transcriptional regulator
VEYLISRGRKKIALFNYVPVMHFSRERKQGYVDALEAAGMKITKDYMVVLEQASCELAFSYALEILSQQNRPDAVFATSDLYAIGILRAAKKLGIRVPEDLAIIGFDDIPFASMTDPPLTTIRQPFSDIGSRACELILEKIANHKAPKRRIILEGELIIRGSTP